MSFLLARIRFTAPADTLPFWENESLLVVEPYTARCPLDLSVPAGEWVRCCGPSMEEWIWVQRGTDEKQGFIPTKSVILATDFIDKVIKECHEEFILPSFYSFQCKDLISPMIASNLSSSYFDRDGRTLMREALTKVALKDKWFPAYSSSPSSSKGYLYFGDRFMMKCCGNMTMLLKLLLIIAWPVIVISKMIECNTPLESCPYEDRCRFPRSLQFEDSIRIDGHIVGECKLYLWNPKSVNLFFLYSLDTDQSATLYYRNGTQPSMFFDNIEFDFTPTGPIYALNIRWRPGKLMIYKMDELKLELNTPVGWEITSLSFDKCFDQYNVTL
ncbi:unnamed protein product [Caenorhabditis bovis]|uniref:SH3 domain-containing protein n=1 Tax=Caenorhabditis bovis TaxID=2654633 RepID=A0A8S1F1W5_9PELO|nr:unnamed protein product [Caenorhabditis bovis]